MLIKIKPKALLVLGILANQDDGLNFAGISLYMRKIVEIDNSTLGNLLDDMYDAKMISREHGCYFVSSCLLDVQS